MKKHLPPLLVFLGFTVALEIAATFHFINASLIPSPTQIIKTLIENHEDFWQATLETFVHTGVGFLLSLIIGSTLALLFSISDFLRRGILPYAIFFQTVPIIAIAPLFVIYFGFGAPTVIAASFMVSVFPIMANTLIGLQSVGIQSQELFQIYAATRWQKLLKLQIPAAFNQIYAGVKISAGLSVIGSVAGEFVAGGGLGALIDSARTQQRVDIVFGALILLSVIGLALVGIVNLARTILLRWRPFIS